MCGGAGVHMLGRDPSSLLCLLPLQESPGGLWSPVSHLLLPSTGLTCITYTLISTLLSIVTTNFVIIFLELRNFAIATMLNKNGPLRHNDISWISGVCVCPGVPVSCVAGE